MNQNHQLSNLYIETHTLSWPVRTANSKPVKKTHRVILFLRFMAVSSHARGPITLHKPMLYWVSMNPILSLDFGVSCVFPMFFLFPYCSLLGPVGRRCLFRKTGVHIWFAAWIWRHDLVNHDLVAYFSVFKHFYPQTSQGSMKRNQKNPHIHKDSCSYSLAGPTRREWGKFHPQYTSQ